MFCTDPERQSLTQTADDGDDGSGDVDKDGDGTKAYLDLAPARHIEMPGWPHTLRDQSCTVWTLATFCSFADTCKSCIAYIGPHGRV